jgi:hypothetical protein
MQVTMDDLKAAGGRDAPQGRLYHRRVSNMAAGGPIYTAAGQAHPPATLLQGAVLGGTFDNDG